MIKNILVACLLLFTTGICVAGEEIELYLGEIKILKLEDIERVAVGNPKIISNSLINNGQLLLIAETAGSSNLHIWFINGTEKDYTVHVIEQSGNLIRRKIEVEGILSDIDGLEVSIVGDRIVLSGLVAFGHEDTIKTVKETYEEVVVNINFAINTLVRKKLDIEDMLSGVAGLKVRIVGERIVISGEIDDGYEDAITTVQGAFPEVMDLTRVGSLDMDLPENKMVLMNIRITEFNKDYLDTLGIEWDSAVAGPAAGIAFDGATNSVFRATELPITSFNDTLLPGNAISALGYFGLVSEITSRINFAVESGNAVILAEPRLAARSGGEATFHAGGEFPIESSSINGTTIEFKQFGIELIVKPTVDSNNNVHAYVETILSAVDFSIAVGGIPGLLTRKTTADVILGSGQTLVMSGLINQATSKTITGLKFLSEIPILGALFRSETFRNDKSELVIFVTPQVFDANSEINKKAIERARENIAGAIKAIDEESIDIVY